MSARLLFPLLALLALGACRQALVVVLPNEDGTVGAVTLDDGKNQSTIDKANAAAEVRGGSGSLAKVEQNEITDIFALAFSARPPLPKHFRFFYRVDSDELTPGSEAAYPALADELRRRKVYEVEITGHSDSFGPESYDRQLSLERAQAMRDKLVADGFDPRAITIAWRGYDEPLVATPPQTSEPRNRRVEITVR